MKSQIEFFQQDFISLNAYHQGRPVSFDDAKRRLLLKQRELNIGISDNCYKLNQENSFKGTDSFTSLFTKTIPNYIKKFLDINKTKVFVKEDYFIEWHNLITECSPLFLVASFLQSHNILNNCERKEITSVFSSYILENSRYTALVSPQIKQLKKFLIQNDGFYDLHIHLNGITESDAVWQCFLSEKHQNMQNISKRIKTEAFRQQLEQLGLDYSLTDFLKLVDRAKEIRERFFRRIMFKKASDNKRYNLLDNYYNPFILLVETSAKNLLPNEQLRYELLMYIIVLKHIEQKQDEQVAILLHEYLLILGLFQHLLVQNSIQYGFVQFQNITKNDVRAETDKKQLNKYLQLCGNNLDNLHSIEFRFSPKGSIDAQMPLLRQIERDWNSLNKSIITKTSLKEKPNYELIAHFIKQKETEYTNTRFEKLRSDLEKKKKMLVSLKSRKSLFSKKVVAIDAASSEFDTPPEVFAPCFNYLRKQHVFNNITYHAGEDFYHIISGLRAIYEVIIFMHLKNGDRIGHATAAGIDVETWLSLVGKRILIPKGEYMDNLVFVYYLITHEHIEELFCLLPSIDMKIRTLCYEIYDEIYDIAFLISCWKLREYDPRGGKYIYNKKKKDFIEKYNRKDIRKKYEKPCEIAAVEDINEKQLVYLQKAILKVMNRKEIVIEALPTSNLRIGYHKTWDSYQLFTWWQWKKEGLPIPPIVFGTDDPGVFATNIYNEYSLIYCYLVQEKGLSRTEVIDFIKEINENSKIYVFKEHNIES